MWHTPNQRLRALANAKKRERERFKRPFHVKRIDVALSVVQSSEDPSSAAAPEALPARLILNDFSVKGVGLFSPVGLIPGIHVIVGVAEPTKLAIRARVVWCQEMGANSHVLSPRPFSYRMGLEFILSTPEEHAAVKDFWDGVCREYLYSSNAV